VELLLYSLFVLILPQFFWLHDLIITAANLYTVSIGFDENIQSIYGETNEQEKVKD